MERHKFLLLIPGNKRRREYPRALFSLLIMKMKKMSVKLFYCESLDQRSYQQIQMLQVQWLSIIKTTFKLLEKIVNWTPLPDMNLVFLELNVEFWAHFIVT